MVELIWDEKFKKTYKKWVHQHPELKALLCRNHSNLFDVPGGFTPATGATPSCDNDVLPATCVVNIAMRPRPLWGQG